MTTGNGPEVTRSIPEVTGYEPEVNVFEPEVTGNNPEMVKYYNFDNMTWSICFGQSALVNLI